MTPSQQLVKTYVDRGLKLVFWSGVGEAKGPREKNWLERASAGGYASSDYKEGDRVGIMHGVEVSPGRFAVDVDIDWGPGVEVAKALLPVTQFIWGRPSKRVSHCMYTTPDVIPMYAYKDVGKDGKTLIEFRADKHQSMAPPSIWEKDGKREALSFVVDKEMTFIESAAFLKQRVCLSAIGMLLAIHFGKNGFGHEARLCWAGFLMRLGLPDSDLRAMGLALSAHCNNQEVDDVERVIQSTRLNLAKDGKRVKGGKALALLIGDQGKLVVGRINEWVGRDSDFIRTSEGLVVKDNQHNIRKAFELLGKTLTYNAFSDKMLIDGESLEDRQLNDAWLGIDEEFHFRPTFAFFEKVVHKMAWDAPFHPVKDYLAGLTWDGSPRLDGWLTACAGVAHSPYSVAIGSIVLIAAIRRIHHPGAKFDELLILEGGQGLGKSTALRALCPSGDWFSDDLPLNTTSQKVIECTLGKWIIEASELAGRRKGELEHLKASLSRQVDGPARLAYAHLPVERPRQFIIVGTTNSPIYLNDPTGARRFWPVAIQAFDVALVAAMRDQLWAEAAVREAADESIRLPEHLWKEAGQHQEKRRERDPWEDTLRAFLLGLQPSSDGKRRCTAAALWSALSIPVERRDRFGALRIAEVMHRLGFKRTTVRADGEVQTGYANDYETLGLLEGDETSEATLTSGEEPDVAF